MGYSVSYSRPHTTCDIVSFAQARMNIPVSLLLQSVSNRIHAAAGVILYPSALLVAYWTVLRCTTWAATNTFFDELIYWPGPLRRRVVRRKFFTRLRDATAVILMVASCSMIFYNSLAPPLSVTHPILSDKWGPSSRAFGALPPASQRRQQAPSREATGSSGHRQGQCCHSCHCQALFALCKGRAQCLSTHIN